MNWKKDEHRTWTDQLSAYMEGDLSEEAFQDVEAHLAECGACRRVLEELRDVVVRAGALDGIEPPRDLWSGIAATIQAPAPRVEDEVKVIAFPTAADAATTGQERHDVRRFTFSRPQLIAASLVLIAASSMATWLAGPGLGVRADESEQAALTADPFVMASNLPEVTPPSDIVDELARLENVLREASDRLDPNTVRVLERNLGVIEKAIDDSRRALAQDPGNTFLTEHLDRVYQRKLQYLREAAQVAEWSS